MTCSSIAYPTSKVKANGTRFRILPLEEGSRTVPVITLTAANAVAVDDETLVITTALTKPLWAGDILTFDKDGPAEVDITLADSVAIGEVNLPIVPATGAVAANATAETIATVFVAGVTDIPINAAPTTNQSSDLLSGDFTETSITGASYTMPITMNRVNLCPGQNLLLDLIFNETYLYREVYAELIRPTGEKHAGACVCTASNQTGQTQQDVTMSLTLAFNGCSLVFEHERNAPIVGFPTV